MQLEYSPGSPEDLFGRKVRLLVAQMTYPELVNFLIARRTPQEAEKDLHDISSGICESLLKIWKPKSRKVVGLIKELLKVIWKGKLKYKILERTSDKRPLTVEFIDVDCKLCKSEGEILEAEGIHYCAAVAGFIEYLLNFMAEQGTMQLNYKSVVVKTISSKANGDDRCAHLVTFNYEE
ncbi:MAG: hypothetical protein ACTSQI_05540 [Candidatus Helarchaeota archaeon]